MKNRNSADLVKRLIDNRISREELDSFLDGLDDEDKIEAYQAYLSHHFEEIMVEYIKEKGEKMQDNF